MIDPMDGRLKELRQIVEVLTKHKRLGARETFLAIGLGAAAVFLVILHLVITS